MPNIQVLDSHIADLIAAGEVVERPSSVAKELMENAIDAGASAITVEISHGGMTYLRVTDNGKGIPADELVTAFLRHATSKLRSAYDLEAIGTLGFRGEALAAISAVSRIEVMSRTEDAPLGATLRLEGGTPGRVEEAGCPLGTTMVVRDLFYNTPARLKFMKKDAAEGAAVFAVVQREALSHPEVSVKFIRDGKQELLTPGDGRLQSAVYSVLGRELALGFLPVNASGEEMTLSGFVSMPACCRGSRSWQFFFVNGRQVKSPLMAAALEQAYQNQKMVGKFPGCVLHLKTKLSAVDVNVHPAKTEIKFGNERQVFSAVYHGVLSALEGDRSHPKAELKPAMIAGVRGQDTVTPNQTRIGEMAGGTEGSGKRPASAPLRPSTCDRNIQKGSRAPAGVVQVHDAARPAAAVPPAPVQTSAFPVGEMAGPAVTPCAVSRGAAPAILPDLPKKPEPASGVPVSTVRREAERLDRSGSALKRPAEGRDEAQAGEIQGVEPVEAGGIEPAWRLAGEVFNTYIIVEQGDTVYLIDKHAAHERMNFDRMKQSGYDPMAQSLLAPVICRLSVQEQEALLAHGGLLEEFGFEIDRLGQDLAVRQAPFDVAVEDIPATLEEIAQKLLTTGGADPASARDGLLHTMACKAAIKGGWKTSPQELERVAQAVMSGRIKYCPHGRPVAIELTKKEMEKQFKRT